MSSPDTAPPNADQATYWNGEESAHWIQAQDHHDAMLAPFTPHLLGGARIADTDEVLDVGCGCGATTLAAAREARRGHTFGIDLSGPMIEVATHRARDQGVNNVRFEAADVQVHDFEPARFDRMISRFGIMFFDDPVAAFGNIARSLRSHGTAAFVCWQRLVDNPWLAIPGAAFASHAPAPTASDPDAPGPFAFGDPHRIRRVLEQADFEQIGIEAVEEALLLGHTVDEAVSFLSQTGMVRRMLATVDPPTRSRALGAAADALRPYESSAGLRLPSRSWLVTATASG
jgi:SAM-dependent methyltransferase